jgi:hypothetical protein
MWKDARRVLAVKLVIRRAFTRMVADARLCRCAALRAGRACDEPVPERWRDLRDCDICPTVCTSFDFFFIAPQLHNPDRIGTSGPCSNHSLLVTTTPINDSKDDYQCRYRYNIVSRIEWAWSVVRSSRHSCSAFKHCPLHGADPNRTADMQG